MALFVCLAGCSSTNQANEKLDTSARRPVVERIPAGVDFNAEYKFTGVRKGEDTQLAWKVSWTISNPPPKPPPEKRKGFGRLKPSLDPYDELCLGFDYSLRDADGFMLEIPSRFSFRAMEHNSWSYYLWVNQDAALRTARITGTLELKWRQLPCSSYIGLRPADSGLSYNTPMRIPFPTLSGYDLLVLFRADTHTKRGV